MSDAKVDHPYIYQPFGMQHPQWWADKRVYGVRHPDWRVEIKGLTRAEAEVVRDALVSLGAREELTKQAQDLGMGY